MKASHNRDQPPPPLLTKEERRARRELRREKQRHANVGRAAKMHAARLLWEKQTKALLPAMQSSKVHVGCSGWFYWHWRGGFYPSELSTASWLPLALRRLLT